MRTLPYHQPVEGADYWMVDDILPDPMATRMHCLEKSNWEYGFPHTRESWPGVRTMPALAEPELALVAQTVRRLTGVSRLWVGKADNGAKLNHNCAQIVNRMEGQCRSHTNSRNLCRLAGVLYLSPDAPARCGTALYRQRIPDGSLGGNTVEEPHINLVDALGTRFVAPDSFVEDVRVQNRFNRLLLYRANLIHSATRYCGTDPIHARMTAVFFWMA